MPRRHPPEKRAQVLADVPDLGITATALKHAISKQTVSEWAKAAGVRTVRNERMAEARAAHAAHADELRAAVSDRMWEIADRASKRELELLGAADLRSVVGARTRAIHDAELLSGRATSRVEHAEPIDAEIARLVSEMGQRADA